MRAPAQWVVFGLDACRIAVPLLAVERVIRAAQVTPLPLAPGTVIGVINIAGDVLPVLNLRRKFRLPEREVDPTDHFVIARTTRGTLVMVVDVAYGVLAHQATAMTEAVSLTLDTEHISGALTLHDGLVLIHDVERFLSPAEGIQLDEALKRRLPREG